MLPHPPRLLRYTLAVVLAIVTVGCLLRFTNVSERWRELPLIRHREDSILFQELKSLEDQAAAQRIPSSIGTTAKSDRMLDVKEGVIVPGQNYTRTIVVGKRKRDNIQWMAKELPDIQQAVYVVDDRRAPLHPPKNKGNEVMVYLSYIIDHYDELPDINIFVHAHRFAWHNNDLFGGDMALMLQHLGSEKVIREGYVNLKCQWFPGCPGWLKPNAQEEDPEKKEEMFVGQAFRELFPGKAMPEVLGQPCCSQFALSRERIRAVSLAEYEHFRNWILKTKIRDNMSGRVFEYLWQYIFTGEYVHCPSQHVCYCDGYGVCFEDEDDFQNWFKIRYYVREDAWKLESWQENEHTYEEYMRKGKLKDAERVERAPAGVIEELKLSVDQRWIELDMKREQAIERGRDPRHRAKIAGRPFEEETTP